MSHIFPLVYILCCRKNESESNRRKGEYSNIKTEAESRGWDFGPENIVLDFELLANNVLQVIFPNANIHGCFFHYSRSVWKHDCKSRKNCEYCRTVRRLQVR